MRNLLTHSALAMTICFAPAFADAQRSSSDAAPGFADNDKNNSACSGLPTYAQLKTALASATDAETTGLNMNMWGTVVNRDGVVCAVAFTGVNRGAQWPGSRVISA